MPNISAEILDRNIAKAVNNGYEIGFRDGWNSALEAVMRLVERKEILPEVASNLNKENKDGI